MAPRKIVTPDVLGILPLQDAVLFPNTVIPLAVIKRPGIALVEEALREGKQIGLVVLKDKDIEDPGPDDLRRIGTIGTIQKMLKVPDGTLRCIVAGGPVTVRAADWYPFAAETPPSVVRSLTAPSARFGMTSEMMSIDGVEIDRLEVRYGIETFPARYVAGQL